MRYLKRYNESRIDFSDEIILNCKDILLPLSEDNLGIGYITVNPNHISKGTESCDICIIINDKGQYFKLSEDNLSDIYRLIDYLSDEGFKLKSLQTLKNMDPNRYNGDDLNREKIKDILIPILPWQKSMSQIILKFNQNN